MEEALEGASGEGASEEVPRRNASEEVPWRTMEKVPQRGCLRGMSQRYLSASEECLRGASVPQRRCLRGMSQKRCLRGMSRRGIRRSIGEEGYSGYPQQASVVPITYTMYGGEVSI